VTCRERGERRRERVRAAALAFAAAFALSVAATEVLVTVATSASGGAGGGTRAEAVRHFALSAPGLMAAAGLEGAVLVAVAVAGVRLEGGNVAERLRLAGSGARGRVAARAGAAMVGLIGLTFAYGAIVELAGLSSADGSGPMAALEAALRHPSAAGLLAAALTLVVVPAVGEEALFRGFIQTALSESLGRWPAIALSGTAFGIFHRDPVQGTGAFLAGLFLGWTLEQTGSLLLTIAAHAANNATFVVLASLGLASGLPVSANLVALGLGTVVCAGALVLLKREHREERREGDQKGAAKREVGLPRKPPF
jgi:membrane protease YdiL (CAAX protease family)